MTTPVNFFRFGESVRCFSAEFKPGDFLEKDHVWDQPQGQGSEMAFDVQAVSWDIFVKDREDLEELLWYGSLFWEFVQVPYVPIAPLSLFDGSFLDLFHRNEGLTELEQIAKVVPELEWSEMAKTFLAGRGLLYRGLKTYRKHPVALPPSAVYRVHLSTDGTKITFRDRVRLRVNLIGVFKTVIEVG
jgi:hypothetical protein